MEELTREERFIRSRYNEGMSLTPEQQALLPDILAREEKRLSVKTKDKKILAFIKNGGSDGVSRTEIKRKFAAMTSEKIQYVIDALESEGTIYSTTIKTRTNKATKFFVVENKK